ncbi:hypothetical protein D3C80_1602270 [compost metagenome]
MIGGFIGHGGAAEGIIVFSSQIVKQILKHSPFIFGYHYLKFIRVTRYILDNSVIHRNEITFFGFVRQSESLPFCFGKVRVRVIFTNLHRTANNESIRDFWYDRSTFPVMREALKVHMIFFG